MPGTGGVETWQRFDIERIEDLGNAVLGAGLEAVQMTGPPVRGSLAFAARDGIVFSSGLLVGNVLLRGVPAADAVTLLLVLTAGCGSWLQLRRAADGALWRLRPGEVLDAYLTAGTLYLAATASPDRLEAVALPAVRTAESSRDERRPGYMLTARRGIPRPSERWRLASCFGRARSIFRLEVRCPARGLP